MHCRSPVEAPPDQFGARLSGSVACAKTRQGGRYPAGIHSIHNMRLPRTRSPR
jgi:hypothetical protein